MGRQTTRVFAGDWDRAHTVIAFCTEQFGAGGVQADRRWFYRLLSGTFKTFQRDGHRFRVMSTPTCVAVYFRTPADAVWFTLKQGAEHGHV